MSENSKIEWTDHTFNPWWGCTKVNSTCAHCYAERLDHRWGGDHWGPRNPRRMILGEWSKPEKWNRAAREAGRIDRVFCASMCDIFEDNDGPVVNQQGQRLYFDCDCREEAFVARVSTRESPVPVSLDLVRQRTFALIDNTPNLLWLLLTKRPANVLNMVPPWWLDRECGGEWPTNVMTGYSAGTQEDLEGRHKNAEGGVLDLMKIPGRHFLSIEPLTAAMDLGLRREVLTDIMDADPNRHPDKRGTYPLRGVPADAVTYRHHLIHWVIVGGESGADARPFDIQWPRDIIAQCRSAGVPCFVKQVGSKPVNPTGGCAIDCQCGLHHGFKSKKGGDPDEWPEDLRVREMPEVSHA